MSLAHNTLRVCVYPQLLQVQLIGSLQVRALRFSVQGVAWQISMAIADLREPTFVSAAFMCFTGRMVVSTSRRRRRHTSRAHADCSRLSLARLLRRCIYKKLRRMTIKVSAKFDAGNVEVSTSPPAYRPVSLLGWTSSKFAAGGRRQGPKNIQLKIRPDPYCKGDDITHFQ